jgi:4a-hydroxytetrahydrobiopterin dehydratase
MNKDALAEKRCKPCEGGVPPLSADEADRMLQQLEGWKRQGPAIEKVYTFSDYYRTMAFVNAAAYVAHREDHHPDLLVGYKTCKVTFTTHAIGGLSENDFICAARLDALAG